MPAEVWWSCNVIVVYPTIRSVSFAKSLLNANIKEYFDEAIATSSIRQHREVAPRTSQDVKRAVK
jgi:hypothetical protein